MIMNLWYSHWNSRKNEKDNSRDNENIESLIPTGKLL